MAKLKAVIDTIESVDEKFRDLYTKRADGKYELDTEGGTDLSFVRKAISDANQEAQRLRVEAAKYKDVDPEKYRKLLADAAKADEEKARAEGDFKALERQLLEKHDTEKKGITTERDRWKDIAINSFRTREIGTALAKHKGEPAFLTDAIARQTQVLVADDGTLKLQVVGADGKPRIADSQGSPMTLDQLVEDLKKDKVYSRAFEGTNAAGSGSQPGAPGQSNGNVYTISRADAHDTAKYRAAREAAAKAGQQLQISE